MKKRRYSSEFCNLRSGGMQIAKSPLDEIYAMLELTAQETENLKKLLNRKNLYSYRSIFLD